MHPEWDAQEDARPVVRAGAQRTPGSPARRLAGLGEPPPPLPCRLLCEGVGADFQSSPYPLSPHPPILSRWKVGIRGSWGHVEQAGESETGCAWGSAWGVSGGS